MNKKPVQTWPKDFLTPIIDDEIKQLLSYLTRDTSWHNCFDIRVNTEAITTKLKNGKLKNILKKHPEVSNDYISDLVAKITLGKGLAVSYKGGQMVIQEKKKEQI